MERWHTELDTPRITFFFDIYERANATLHAQLDEATINAANAEGHALTMEQAIELAMSDPE